jgi:hypothetical protein
MITIEILGKVKGTKWCALPTKACHAAFFKISKFFYCLLTAPLQKAPSIGWAREGCKGLDA